ncbi:cytochrome b5-like heme/steroid binding domain-containing protein, partial [Rhodocollybia butyracea]
MIPSFEHLKLGNSGLITSALLAAPPLLYLFYKKFTSSSPSSTAASVNSSAATSEKPKSIMQPARTDLSPPKDDPITMAELKEFDGREGKPIYVAIKGTVFDVTHKSDVYGAGKSYNIFAGKDGSKGLGMSSLKPEHAIADYSDLDEKDMKTLNDWHTFFLKRYNVVGRVSDLPESVRDNEVSNMPPASL